MSLDRSLITQKRFDACVQEVILEKQEKVRSNPFCTAYDVLYETAFTQSPYRYYTLGHLDDLKTLRLADGVRYYEENYNPSNISLFCLTGPPVEDWNEEKMLEIIEEIFGGFTDQAQQPELKIEEPPQKAVRLSEALSDKGVFLAGVKARPYSRLEEPARLILNKILINAKSEIRNSVVDQIQGLGTQAPMTRQTSLNEIIALVDGPNHHTFFKMKSALEKDFTRMSKGRFGNDEIEDAKSKVIAYFRDIQNNPVKRIEKMASACLLDSKFISFKKTNEILSDIRTEDLKKLAAMSFDWNQVTLIYS